MPGRHYTRLLGLLIPLLLLILLITGLFVAGANATRSLAAEDGCQSFSETGFKLCGKFLDYWNTHGGLTQQGYPISEVFEEQNAAPPAGDGKVHRVQYLQRARFEEHLENAAPYDVLLGLLGSEQFGAKYSAGTPSPIVSTDNCQTFSDTGFQACGRFLDYWNTHGGLTQQGYPISGVFVEQNAPPPAGDGKPHRVQYFQRGRFEEHLENAAPYDVLLGLLGAEQYGNKYAIRPPGVPSSGPTVPATTVSGQPPTDPTPVPTPPLGAPIAAAGCLPSISSAVAVQVCVKDINPPADPTGTNTVYARLVLSNQAPTGVEMKATWHYRTKNAVCSGTSSSDGVASCTLPLDGAEARYEVFIDVVLTYQGKNYFGAASFIPR